MEKKSIERLFQEKFKDFESIPPPSSWSEIEKKLEKKKKRRVIPIWWWIGGAAALLIFGSLGFQLLRINGASNNAIQINSPELLKKDTPIVLEAIDQQDVKNSNEQLNETFKGEGSAENEDVDVKNKRKEKMLNSPQKTYQKYANIKESSTNTNKTSLNTDEIELKNFPKENSKLTAFELTKNSVTEKSVDKFKNIIPIDSVLTESLEATVEISIDKNALEELLLEKEKKEELNNESKRNRWQVSTALAPVFFNSASNESPIDPMFENNAKDFENSTSVGLGIQYALTSKVSIRTGINKINYGQNTNNIMFYPDLSGIGISNIKQGEGTVMMVVPRPDKSNTVIMNLNNFESSKTPGQLNQRLGFIEVPMEVSYKIIDKKFGFQVIGGVSSLFLTDNQIRIVSDEFSMQIGEANNVNPLHFSTNIGLGVDYQFLKSFRASVEPMFKYQLNTFSNGSGNFRPYFIGVYSGISYQF